MRESRKEDACGRKPKRGVSLLAHGGHRILKGEKENEDGSRRKKKQNHRTTVGIGERLDKGEWVYGRGREENLQSGEKRVTPSSKAETATI